MRYHKKLNRFSCIFLITAMLVCPSCSAQKEPAAHNTEIKELEYNSEYASVGTKVCALDVTTTTTTDVDHREHKLYLSEFDEPIYITFGLIGEDSQAVLRLYYDYEPISFLAAGSTDYTDAYVFDIKGGTRLEIPVRLNTGLEKDDLTHKLMVSVVLDCDRHASDASSQTELKMYGSAGVFDLSFSEVANKRETSMVESKYSIVSADDYGKYSYASLNITDAEQDLGAQGFDGPEKIYVKRTGEMCSLNYTVSKFDSKVENALILLTVEHKPIQINNQDYLFIDMRGNTTVAGKMSFELPANVGEYDVIGYVVFDPFSYASMDLSDIPQSSTRFTIMCTN